VEQRESKRVLQLVVAFYDDVGIGPAATPGAAVLVEQAIEGGLLVRGKSLDGALGRRGRGAGLGDVGGPLRAEHGARVGRLGGAGGRSHRAGCAAELDPLGSLSGGVLVRERR
jgi:hypothetical protein